MSQRSHELTDRLQEYLAMQRAPPPFIWACPEEKNILDCECTRFKGRNAELMGTRAFHYRISRPHASLRPVLLMVAERTTWHPL